MSSPTLSAGTFLGDTLLTRTLSGVSIFSTRYAPSARFTRHDHERASLCLVRAGAYEEDYGRQACTYAHGAVVLHPAGDHHANVHADDEVRLLVVEFDTPYLERLQARVDVLRERGSAFSRPLATLGARLEQEFLCGDAASDLACEGLVLEALATVARAPAPRHASRPAWLGRVEEALHDGGRDAASLSRLAVLAGVHATQIARVFRRVHGCSIGDYKRRVMLDEARRRLSTTRDAISQIALDCGFADQSHLNRCFRAAYATSPARFRSERGR